MTLNLKHIVLFAESIFMLYSSNAMAQTKETEKKWAMQPVALATRWAKDVQPESPLKAYPRPQMERSYWRNLNGLWDYAITGKDAKTPEKFDGQILVPFPLESALSGVKKGLKPEEWLWYRRNVSLNPLAGKKTILHFGAVDYECKVYLNGLEVGGHEGGYTAFSFDVTPFLKPGNNELLVRVYDPSDQGIGPRGKQVLNPANIYYTPSSGIWQTVWMEVVPENYIRELVMTPDIDQEILRVELRGIKGIIAKATIPDCEDCRVLTQTQEAEGLKLTIKIPHAKLWSPANPHLYILQITAGEDMVRSYFGMRKVSVAKDKDGTDRIFINNKPYFNLGTLDQGFWPDGLYTAPTDEALAFDLKAIKAMGFNTIRKHIKVEPARWYYHADKLGMLVWQDFVQPNPALPEGAKAAFEKQGAEMMAQLHNAPSIVTWVLFNEKWGAYDQERLTKWVKATDPSRLVNGHSGEYLYVNEMLRSPSPNAYVAADMTDVHSYPDPKNALKQEGKAQVLGEFGGIGVFIPDHQWNTGTAWGYVNEKPGALAAKYKVMNQHLQLLKDEGLSASIYTQPFDVEGEQNGLMTYDREIIKVPFEELRKIHRPLNPDAELNVPAVTASTPDLREPALLYTEAFDEYMNGKNDPAMLKKLSLMATRLGDHAGRKRFTAAYLAASSAPFNRDKLEFIASVTKKLSDPGFTILLEAHQARPAKDLRKQLTEIIYNDLFAAPVTKIDQEPDWKALETSVTPYGILGDEIYLRTKTVYLYNKRNWDAYRPVAKLYIEKYGANLSPKDRATFENKLEEN